MCVYVQRLVVVALRRFCWLRRVYYKDGGGDDDDDDDDDHDHHLSDDHDNHDERYSAPTSIPHSGRRRAIKVALETGKEVPTDDRQNRNTHASHQSKSSLVCVAIGSVAAAGGARVRSSSERATGSGDSPSL